MPKKLGANDGEKGLAEPSGMAGARDGAQAEFEIALDPGPDLDPEGWMAERRNYWAEQNQVKKHGCVARWIAAMRAILARLNPSPSARRQARLAQATELTHDDWTLLSESALGPLRPVHPLQPIHSTQSSPPVHPAPKDCGFPSAPLDHGALPGTGTAQDPMSPSIRQVSALPVPNPEEHAQASIREFESDAAPVSEPFRAAGRRRP